jgi:dTDP-glucose pyrophosphorylase/mRNA-degrading endonuclease RelE of RelBE toxin-antitoxin system
MDKELNNNKIFSHQTIREALEKLNELPETLTLFILNLENQLIGTLTDGDIRRSLLKGISIDDVLENVMFKDFRFIRLNQFTSKEIKKYKELNLRLIPLLDDSNKIIKILNISKLKALLPIDAVMMAGGRGERLRPLTDSTPKPLLKVGGKSIIERNIDRLAEYGISDLSITIKYLGHQIVEKFGNGESKNISIKYVEETEPLGTIGSVSLIEDFKNDSILVMNSDLLTNIDFEDFYNDFTNDDADMAVASIPYKVDIPYAVIEKEGNRILSFKEKPTYTYYSNAGIYLIKRKLLHLIPVAKHFNATDFMEALIEQGGKVIHFPIHGYWLDIGKHDDFNKAQEEVAHIKF